MSLPFLNKPAKVNVVCNLLCESTNEYHIYFKSRWAFNNDAFCANFKYSLQFVINEKK